MLRDLEILNIDYSAANADYRRTETHKVSELNGRVLIPFEGPMFARNLVVRADGTPLTIEKDYVLEDDFDELELMTGKKVIGCIRVSRTVLNDYKEIKIAYQKVGEVIISRDFLLRAGETILNNTKPIDWLTEVFGKPDTFPPTAHIHDVRETSELIGFKDLLLIFKQASGQTKMHGLDLWNRLKLLEEKAYNTLQGNYKELWDKIFSHIMNVSVPHPMTKADIGLGNHPNYATATREEDQKAAFYSWDDKVNGAYALRDDVISTPNGVSQAIDNYEINTDGFIKQGSLPFSYYGSGFYLPPPIAGSFEGLGTNTGGNALCVESNGYTVLLTRGYDSKVRKLYYYYNKNIYANKADFVFSGFAYQSQVMENNGHEPNHIVSGSNGRLLVIGDKEKGQYYITLGNGTLDAASHQLMKIDMSSFYDSNIGASMWDPDKAYVMLIGDYVYIIAQQNGWAPTIPESERFGTSHYRLRSFYRIPVSDLIGDPTKVITFVRQKITYQNSEGETKENQEYIDIAKNVTGTDSEGKLYLKRCVYNYTTPPTTAALGNPWRCQWMNMEDPNNKNRAAIRMFHNTRWQYDGRAKLSGDWWFCIPMFFDATTNTLSLDTRFFNISRDIITGETTVPDGKNMNDWYHSAISSFCAGHAEVAASFIPKLGYVAARSNSYYLPYNMAVAFMGYNQTLSDAKPGLSDWEIFNQTLSGMGGNGWGANNIPLDSPFGFTTKPCMQRDLWEYNGKVNTMPVEMFNALDRVGNKTLWARLAKDNYQYATGDMFKFKYISQTVIGRPPSTYYMAGSSEGYNQTYAAKLPVVNCNTKDKHSVQYGIVNIVSQQNVNSKLRYTAGLYHASEGRSDFAVTSDGDMRISLLGKHTIDPDSKLFTVEHIPSESIVVKKSVWIGLLKQMLGSKFSTICDENGGNGSNGEYALTLYFGSKAGTGTDAFPSLAMLVYHTFSDPAKTYGVLATFNWNVVSTESTGERVISIANVKYPVPNYSPTTATVIYENLNYTTNGVWSSIDTNYASEALNAEVHFEFTDSNNYEIWISSGLNQPIPLNAASSTFYMKMVGGVVSAQTFAYYALYGMGGITAHWQYVTDLGMCRPVNTSLSGGAALYTQGGKIPSGQYCLMQAVFIEGNWTLFVNSDLTAIFNGTQKELLKTNYDLSTLGIDQKNKTFYLYAVSGKTQGYYDLSLSERTASPYHLLVATITTNSFGIEEILVEQKFAISGFSITTANKGGSVPATSGTFPDTGTFEAIVKEDLFDASSYQ